MPAKPSLPMREPPPEAEQQRVSAREAPEPRNAARDGSALARAQREAAEARHAVELQERLVGVVGHDLRTPLAAIQMGIALLLRKGGLSPDQARTVGRLGASAGRMTAIIRDLLDFTRVRKEGAIPLEPKPVDLAEVCRRAVTELRQAHPNRGIALATPPAIPLVGDPERLLQVASNLVGNAIQHSPPESEVVVRLIASAAEAVLEVHNDGAPIPAELLPDLFEPFRQAVRGPDPTGSIGLGLFIVRALVDAHGGRVEARSTSDEGTTFTVRLPRGA
jgi:signal transduction histidine kinase